MTIRKKLTMNIGIIMMAIITMILIVLISAKTTQKNIDKLTQETAPYQLKALTHQKELQSHTTHLVNLSIARSLDEYKKEAALTTQSLANLKRATDALVQFKAESNLIDDHSISEITKAVLEVTEHKIKAQDSALKVAGSIQEKLAWGEKSLESFIQGLQQKGASLMTNNSDLPSGKDNHGDLLKTIEKLKATTQILSMVSGLSLLNASLMSHINHSIHSTEMGDFNQESSVVENLFKEANGKGQKLRDFLAESDNNDGLRMITLYMNSLSVVESYYSGKDGVVEKMRASIKYLQDLNQLIKKMRNLVANHLAKSNEAVSQAGENQDQMVLSVIKAAKKMVWMITLVGGMTVFISLFMGTWINRSIHHSLHRVITGLTRNAEQVASASTEVSSAARSLAEGASEQAAGIEETSSSIEEMTSMTKQNAENAWEANQLMINAIKVVGKADQAMKEVIHSMSEISGASEETAKIIKTIDEIAFQTNLLALNAAVEAARAGESGAGFAVVADEVRNLALRATEAARDTAHLIQETVKKIRNGSEMVTQTSEIFINVASGAQKVSQLVSNIAVATKEQAQGIEQINRAITEMDKVVQRNAASAEESASAAEEMSAQAGMMKGFVNELVGLVGKS